MDNKQLDSLVKIGQLKKEPFSQSEDETYLRSGKERLGDAAMAGMSLSSKFLLGYGAAYSFSLAALRRRGYRPVNRYIVFQCLPHTLSSKPGLASPTARRQNGLSIAKKLAPATKPWCIWGAICIAA